MPADPPTLLVLARAPLPGRSKTRLAPAFGPLGAARLAAAAMIDTLVAVLAADAVRMVLALDGDLPRTGAVTPGALPSRLAGPLRELAAALEVVPQAGDGHGERIAAALEVADGPALLVGTDTPQLRPAHLARSPVPGRTALLGPAADGGWWALGLGDPRRDARAALQGVPMSTPVTGLRQRGRLRACGLTVADLPVLRDVDEPRDAHAVAALAPHGVFAAELARLLDERAAVPAR